ncbi:MAG: type IV pilin protein [Peptococcales bacterium]
MYLHLVSKKYKNTKNKGFSLIEILIVTAILSILVSIVVPVYKDYVERTTRQVCNTNCQQLERIYHIYLIIENKVHTPNEFGEFLRNYEGEICPANGDVEYKFGTVKCILHHQDEANGNNGDEDEGNVPYL